MTQLCLYILAMILPLNAPYVALNSPPGCTYYGEAVKDSSNVNLPHGFGVRDCGKLLNQVGVWEMGNRKLGKQTSS